MNQEGCGESGEVWTVSWARPDVGVPLRWIPGPYDHSYLVVITDSEATLPSWRPGVWGTRVTLPTEVWPFGGALALLYSTPAPDSQRGPCVPATWLFTCMLAPHL